MKERLNKKQVNLIMTKKAEQGANKGRKNTEGHE